MKFDWVIVGAGFSGAVLAERIATQKGQKVLVIERRNHIGGNAYDFYDENGVLIHKYGPHIFHTNSRKAWEYLSHFTGWRPHFHKVLAVIDGHKVPIPFNLNTLYKLFSPVFASRIEEKLVARFGFGLRLPILELQKNEDNDLKFIADYIFRNLFCGYTQKQWELNVEELDPSVTSRVPVLISRDNRYFQDKYQGIPKNGYTVMFQKMLDHPEIKILLNTDYREIIEDVKFNRMIYTGPVDAFFDYLHGSLPYRSLSFDFNYYGMEVWQEAGQINYPNEYRFTRTTEFKYLTGQNCPGTTVSVEYPEAYEPGRNEPYYPIPRKVNDEQYELYKNEMGKLNKSVLFVGRLADYKYYNMDQAVVRALSAFEDSDLSN
ncbi:MAG: UDP-galactopyranose mutase [Thermodesulfobacteriota bacterium]|nr:UDP-galactopyranose mutase [Thermodesulfobacteriota bacterium]